MGNPVAFDASAEERDTRGFISMTTMSPFAGLTANWMLDPPVSTPMRRMQAKAASRIVWYSTSVRVWAGATVIESPVWTPIGSKFSMEQTTTALSAPSRMTSSSYSFQPGDRLLEEDLGDGAGGQAVGGDGLELGGVVGEAGPAAAEDERRPADQREADLLGHGHGLVERVGDARLGGPPGRSPPWPP